MSRVRRAVTRFGRAAPSVRAVALPMEPRVLLAVLVHYDFTGNTGIEANEPADLVADHLTATPVARGVGLIASGRTGWSDCLTSGGWTTNASFDNSDYYSFGAWTVAPGYAMSLDTLRYADEADAAGPDDFRLMASRNGFVDYFEVVTGAFPSSGATQRTVDLAAKGATFRNLTGTIEFRLLGYRSSSSTGKLRLLNTTSVGGLAVEGTIVPLDATPPTVLATQFNPAGPTQRVTMRFSEDVQASLSAGDLTLSNLTTGATVPAASMALSYDTASNTATWTFPGLSAGRLANGNYVATLASAGVTDAAGNALDGDGDHAPGGDATLSFFQLAGDINRDRTVDFSDLVIMAQNYETTAPVSYATGDLTGDGKVDFSDLVLVAQNYETTLAAPAAPAAPAATPVAAPVGLSTAQAPSAASPAVPVSVVTPVVAPLPVKAATPPKRAVKPATVNRPTAVVRPTVFGQTPILPRAARQTDVLGRQTASMLRSAAK